MLEIRLHGRGGQGVVTTAELLSLAAFAEGRHAQSFPSFGSERMGAPVTAYCRIDERRIRGHEPVAHPDVLIVVDPTLVRQVAIFAGAREDARALINTSRSVEEVLPESLGIAHASERVVTVPAAEIGRRRLGRPLPGTAMLGAFAALTGAVSLPSVVIAIEQRFGAGSPLARDNAEAARDGHRFISSVRAPESEPVLLGPGELGRDA